MINDKNEILRFSESKLSYVLTFFLYIYIYLFLGEWVEIQKVNFVYENRKVFCISVFPC